MPDMRTPSLLLRLRRIVPSVAGDIAIFAAASVGTYVAQYFDRPISAVLVYLVGVICIGARSGLARGLVAAITASLAYNFFLSEPLFRFTATSAEDLIPLIAFNLSAILTGGMAGRLKDSVRQARAAEAKNSYLLRLSDDLQRAITIPDVASIARKGFPFHGIVDLEIYLLRDGILYPSDGANEPLDISEALLSARGVGSAALSGRAYMLSGGEGEIGVVKFSIEDPGSAGYELPDLQGIANILGLAVGRCMLSEQLSESRAMQKSEELKTAILSSVSHDLRTPLTAIEAAATTLRSYDQTLSPRQREEMLKTISAQCAKLNRYTANLLDMGRIQSGIPDFMFMEIDVVDILGVVLGNVRQTFPGQKIDKQIMLDSAIVTVNPTMLEQVLFNLVENAIVHGRSDRPVMISLLQCGENCVLEVTDFGPGIREDEQALVFNKFYRSRSSVHREGNGLGLHIANGFVEAFGGSIVIASPHTLGMGTKVTVTLPLAEAHFERVGAFE